MTDEELMLAVCDGDQSAYQIIVKQHLRSISHYAFRMLGNQKDTEDITQETFLRLWINAQKWQADKAKLSTWLHRIAHNLCIDYIRKHGNVQTRESFEQREEQLEANESLDESSKIKKLNDAIKRLPESQRSALMLCHYQNFSNKEAAAIMNTSVKALESVIARAKRSLRKHVMETEETSNKSVWEPEPRLVGRHDDDT